MCECVICQKYTYREINRRGISDPHPWDSFINLLAPGRFGNDLESIIFKLILQSSRLGSHSEIAPMWKTGDFAYDESSLVQVITWISVDQCLCRHMASLDTQWVKQKNDYIF